MTRNGEWVLVEKGNLHDAIHGELRTWSADVALTLDSKDERER